MNKGRDSNLELLRIVSIFLIVLHHLVYHTSVIEALSVNRLVAQYYMMGGKLGVNCFVLITGYYACKGRFKLEKLWDIERTTLFYSILFLIIFIILLPSKITYQSVLSSIFPVTFRAYWYVTAYVGMYILSPFLNILINNLKEKEYKLLLIVMFFMLSIIPSFTREKWWFSEIGWFIFLYLIGAYINRMHDYFALKKAKFYIIMSFAFSVVIWLISVAITIAETHIHRLHKYVNSYSVDLYSAPLLLCSVCFFLTFLFIKVKRNEVINKIARHTFGIYLIQSNQFVATYFLWRWIDSYNLHKNIVWPLIALIIAIIIVATCFVIDCIRQKLISIIPPIKGINGFINKANELFSFSSVKS